MITCPLCGSPTAVNVEVVGDMVKAKCGECRTDYETDL